MSVPILRQGSYLIASVQSALTDADWRTLQQELLIAVRRHRSRGVIIDVTALDVLDSYAARTLSSLAHMIRLVGALTVVVGLQPDVAFAMVQLGLTMRFAGVETALDLEDGMELLARRLAQGDRP